MKHTKTTIILSLSVILMLISISIFIFFFVSIKSINKNTSQTLTRLEKNISDVSHGSIMNKAIVDLMNSKADIVSHFIDQNNIDVFVNSIENLGIDGGTNISINSVNIPDSSNHMVSIGFSIRGSFSNVVKTLLLVANSKYKIHIKNVSLTTDVQPAINGKESKPTGIWRAEVSIEALTL